MPTRLPRTLRANGPLAVAGMLLLFGMTGCGAADYDVVPVTGVVTLDGAPLANATVSFMPLSQFPNPDDPFPGSYGKTDGAGKFELRIVTTDKKGAIVGKHRVEITLPQDEDPTNDEIDEDFRNPIPTRYNIDSELIFIVPDGGADSANFDLKSQ